MTNHHTGATMTPAQWHAYIRSASSFAASQDRMGEALTAGIDFADLLAVQGEREAVLCES